MCRSSRGSRDQWGENTVMVATLFRPGGCDRGRHEPQHGLFADPNAWAKRWTNFLAAMRLSMHRSSRCPSGIITNGCNPTYGVRFDVCPRSPPSRPVMVAAKNGGFNSRGFVAVEPAPLPSVVSDYQSSQGPPMQLKMADSWASSCVKADFCWWRWWEGFDAANMVGFVDQKGRRDSCEHGGVKQALHIRSAKGDSWGERRREVPWHLV